MTSSGQTAERTRFSFLRLMPRSDQRELVVGGGMQANAGTARLIINCLIKHSIILLTVNAQFQRVSSIFKFYSRWVSYYLIRTQKSTPVIQNTFSQASDLNKSKLHITERESVQKRSWIFLTWSLGNAHETAIFYHQLSV